MTRTSPMEQGKLTRNELGRIAFPHTRVALRPSRPAATVRRKRTRATGDLERRTCATTLAHVVAEKARPAETFWHRHDPNKPDGTGQAYTKRAWPYCVCGSEARRPAADQAGPPRQSGASEPVQQGTWRGEPARHDPNKPDGTGQAYTKRAWPYCVPAHACCAQTPADASEPVQQGTWRGEPARLRSLTLWQHGISRRLSATRVCLRAAFDPIATVRPLSVLALTRFLSPNRRPLRRKAARPQRGRRRQSGCRARLRTLVGS
jgi:hypothetical protein